MWPSAKDHPEPKHDQRQGKRGRANHGAVTSLSGTCRLPMVRCHRGRAWMDLETKKGQQRKDEGPGIQFK